MSASSSSNVADPNFYTRLGLHPGASVQEVRRAYRDLSKLYHPDTTALESAIATVSFQALNEAYATLSNPEKRIAYDYKVGYSRLSVMQPLSRNAPTAEAYRSTDSAYISASDRPLSPGELFALFILGITFLGCLLLVLTIGLAKSELPITESGDALSNGTLPYDPVQPSVTVPFDRSAPAQPNG
ncbi:MAG: J domain-containing protein [Phormidesmis sp.]